MKMFKYIILFVCITAFFDVKMVMRAHADASGEAVSTTNNENIFEQTTEAKTVTMTYYDYDGNVFYTISGENQVWFESVQPPQNKHAHFLYWKYKEGDKWQIAEWGQIFMQDTEFHIAWVPIGVLPSPEIYENDKISQEHMKAMQRISDDRLYVKKICFSAPKASVKIKKNKVSVTINASKFTKDGFEIQYAASKKLKQAKTMIVKSTKKKAACTIKKIKKKKTYYIRVRAYRTLNPADYGIDGPVETYYSKWSRKTKVNIP